ncbi:MAG: L-aspartate oxidase [Candidatus Eremiobacteraeota bacterium]|nr:L-aspartate oxidase [Candidatus Eremiobacteraeota bacterium]
MDFVLRKYDFVVIGSGVGGLSFALEMKNFNGLVISRSSLIDTNTNLAQGGIASAIGDDDSPAIHLDDTVKAGAGLSDPEAAKILVSEGPSAVKKLVEMGANFDRAPGGKFHLSCEGAHSRRRILHSRGYATGREIQETLLSAVRKTGIRLEEGIFCLDLIIDDNRGMGIWAWDTKSNKLLCILAPVIMLATGGCGNLYLNSTNSGTASGDGQSIAYLAGAVIRDPEMIQFHPTAMFLPRHTEGRPLPLITEALRGEGATLHNAAGERFMSRYHEYGELAPRHVTTLAIFSEMQRESFPCVFLDVSKVENFAGRFPHINEECKKNNIDPGKDRIPVAPVMHYSIGGIKTDLDGRTNLHGVYAAGEVASTGVHGANRLASNSLLEGLVFGKRAGRTAGKSLPALENITPPESCPSFPSAGVPSEASLMEIKNKIKKVMWEKAGIARDESGLLEAQEEMKKLKRKLEKAEKKPVPGIIPVYYSIRNSIILCDIILKAALLRRESRGAHYRRDYPEPLGPEGCHLEFSKDKPLPKGIGEMK